MESFSRRLLILLPLFLAVGGFARADRLITTTGRVLEGKVAEEGENVSIRFASGALMTLAKKFVKQVEIEGDMSSYVPQDDREKEMLASGYVKFRGQWMSKDRYLLELRNAREAAAKKLEEIQKHQTWGNEWRKETRHFEMHSNTSPEILESYADLFETFYEVYFSRFNVQLSPTMQRQKMEVNIFRGEKSYLENSGPEGTAGFFAPHSRELNLYHIFEDPEYSKMVLFHEGTHMMNFLVNPDMLGVAPTWIEESTAEYFSNVRLEKKGGKTKIVPGQIAEDRLGVAQELIAQGKAIPLKKLLFASKNGFDADHYAFGWSFVHFLMNHAKYSKGFQSFYEDLYTGKGMKFTRTVEGKEISIVEANSTLLKRIGAKDLGALEKEWLQYAKESLKTTSGRGYDYRAMRAEWKFRRSKEDGSSSSENPLQLLNKAIDELGYRTSEAYSLRSYFWDAVGEGKKARDDIARAIDLNPTQASYYATRAWLSNVRDRFPDAEGDLQIAIELEPSEPRFPLYLELLGKKGWKEFQD